LDLEVAESGGLSEVLLEARKLVFLPCAVEICPKMLIDVDKITLIRQFGLKIEMLVLRNLFHAVKMTKTA